MILGVTGHRTKRLLEWLKQAGVSMEDLKLIVRQMLAKYKPTHVIVGMALGFDMLVADICIERNIPLIAAVPFEGQDARWSAKDRQHYENILTWSGTRKVVVSPGGYAKWKLSRRNKWIVDHCDVLVSAFDGEKGGGTWNCTEYATMVSRTVDPISLRA